MTITIMNNLQIRPLLRQAYVILLFPPYQFSPTTIKLNISRALRAYVVSFLFQRFKSFMHLFGVLKAESKSSIAQTAPINHHPLKAKRKAAPPTAGPRIGPIYMRAAFSSHRD